MKKDFCWLYHPPKIIVFAPVLLIAISVLAVWLSPILLIVQCIVTACGIIFLGVQYRRYRFLRCIAQLRVNQGACMLVFNNGREPELITLEGKQRILPGYVELNFRCENGKKMLWGITRNAMDTNSFRELKVFLQTRSV